MAATSFDKEKLSVSTDGRGILIAAIITAGNALHVAIASVAADTWDEVFLQAINTDTVARDLTIEWGGVSAPTDTIILTIPPKAGLVTVIDGLILRNGLTVAAFASVTNVIVIHGWVHEIRP